ncbi:hypothetical protein FB451DRAFT_1196697 [Mycena latifolia]|nr:hypothetical protein FB451DRAFT_1196697 [Mycena latifolia]
MAEVRLSSIALRECSWKRYDPSMRSVVKLGRWEGWSGFKVSACITLSVSAFGRAYSMTRMFRFGTRDNSSKVSIARKQQLYMTSSVNAARSPNKVRYSGKGRSWQSGDGAGKTPCNVDRVQSPRVLRNKSPFAFTSAPRPLPHGPSATQRISGRSQATERQCLSTWDRRTTVPVSIFGTCERTAYRNIEIKASKSPPGRDGWGESGPSARARIRSRGQQYGIPEYDVFFGGGRSKSPPGRDGWGESGPSSQTRISLQTKGDFLETTGRETFEFDMMRVSIDDTSMEDASEASGGDEGDGLSVGEGESDSEYLNPVRLTEYKSCWREQTYYSKQSWMSRAKCERRMLLGQRRDFRSPIRRRGFHKCLEDAYNININVSWVRSKEYVLNPFEFHPAASVFGSDSSARARPKPDSSLRGPKRTKF